MIEQIKAYKVFDENWKCNGFQFEVGKTYTHNGPIKNCESGFHACEKVADCFGYKTFETKNKIAEVLCGGAIERAGDKLCCQHIMITREVTWAEMLVMANTGAGNAGLRNSGYQNSGDRNSGDLNSGYQNSGDRNSGYQNSGYQNSGHQNSGYQNSGHQNSGDRNSGDLNSGYQNSGGWNSCNNESGFFNSTASDVVRVFGAMVNRASWENAQKPELIYFNVSNFVYSSEMTDDEKKQNPSCETTGGFIRTTPYREGFTASYNAASAADKLLLYALPKFNAKIFEKISGVDVTVDPVWKNRKRKAKK